MRSCLPRPLARHLDAWCEDEIEAINLTNVIGYLESELPIPLEVDGETVESEGTTIIRWIYPLPVQESDATPVAIAEPPAERERSDSDRGRTASGW